MHSQIADSFFLAREAGIAARLRNKGLRGLRVPQALRGPPGQPAAGNLGAQAQLGLQGTQALREVEPLDLLALQEEQVQRALREVEPLDLLVLQGEQVQRALREVEPLDLLVLQGEQVQRALREIARRVRQVLQGEQAQRALREIARRVRQVQRAGRGRQEGLGQQDPRDPRV
jgi:hypothetical protein